MKKILDLFLTFFKLGVFAFGGGYAIMPMLRREVVENKHYATDEEVVEYYAIGQCTPGLLTINAATFIGRKQAGIPGAFAATLGFVCPSVIIICILAKAIGSYSHLAVIKNAFAGIRACVCVLIINTVIRLWKTAVRGRFSVCIFLLVLCTSLFFSVNPIIPVLCAGTAGVIREVLLSRRSQDPEENDKTHSLIPENPDSEEEKS